MFLGLLAVLLAGADAAGWETYKGFDSESGKDFAVSVKGDADVVKKEASRPLPLDACQADCVCKDVEPHGGRLAPHF